MKTIFTFCTIIYFTSSIVASGIDLMYYTGLWHNPKHGKKIEIIAYDDGFEIMGLHSKYGKKWFERTDKFTFQDYVGNKIRLTNEVIVYIPYRSKRKFTLYKLSSRKKYSKNDNYKTHPNDQQKIYQEHNNAPRIMSYHNRNYDLSNVHIEKIEGSWLARSVDKIIYITETRDGLKARFNNDKKWYSYTFNKKNGEYISIEGHKYQFTTPNLIWIDNAGKKEIFLIKISDDLIE